MKTDKNSYEPMLRITSNPHQENLWLFCTTSPKKNDVGPSLCIGFIKVPPKYLVSSTHKSVNDIYLLSTFATEYFYFCAFYFIVYFFLEQILFTWCEPFIDATGFVLFWAFQTPRRFPWLFPVFHDLKFSCHFRKLSKSSLFSGIFWHNLPVFCFALALTPAIIYVPHTL